MKSKTNYFQAIQDYWCLIKPFWGSKQKYSAYFLLLFLLVCCCLEVYMSVLLNEWNGRFYNTIQNYDRGGFFHELIIGFIIMSLYVFIMIFSYLVVSVLEIKWRKWLTLYYLKEWFTSRAYYNSRFVNCNQDNPDQRISEDIHQFVQLTLQMFVNFFRSLLTLGSFVIILWGYSGSFGFNLWGYHFYIPGYMVWIALLYAVVGTYITFKIGNPLIRINFRQQQYEADFRYNLVRVREYAEQIASYRGDTVEINEIAKDFDNIYDNFMKSVKLNLKVNLFSYSYGQLSSVVPTIVSASRYFAKEITLGNMMQINSAFSRVQYSIAFFIYIYSDIANLKSIMDRMVGFNQLVESTRELVSLKVQDDHEPYLIIKDLDLNLPDNRVLISNFSLTIKNGDRILINGVSGSGKSTLLRAINGLWQSVRGFISERDGLSSLLVPQKPYLPKVNLKEAICYPLMTNLPSDREVIDIMGKCGLGQLTDVLYECRDWGSLLSLGEQQRIIFCRIIINKPDIAYLDEITSSLDEDSASYLYALIFSILPNTAFISVSHDSNLIQYHKQIISLENNI